MHGNSTDRTRAAKQAIYLPAAAQTLGAGPRRAFIVDAVGRKLSAAMPAQLARYRAARINIEVPAGRSKRFAAAEPGTAPVKVQSGVAQPAAVMDDEILGTIRTGSSPYMVSADIPSGTPAAAFDAGWPGMITRLAAAIDRHQVVMQQDPDLRPDQVMHLPKGYQVGTSDQADGPVVAIVIDPYTYGAHQLRADAGRIRDAVRFALSGGPQS